MSTHGGDWADGGFVAHYNQVYATSAGVFDQMATLLGVGPGDHVMDLGCGNGQFLEACAKRQATGMGVDASEDQVASAQDRLRAFPGMQVLQCAFLEMPTGQVPCTKGFSRKALHHLDDDEKIAFFEKHRETFAPGAWFLLDDGIFFDFERRDLDHHWDTVLDEASRYYGDSWADKRRDFEACLRFEYPTGLRAWERALQAAGFAIVETHRSASFYGRILAQKA